MALLSRVAEQLYWGARYIERAEDTVRVIRAYTDVLVDLPTSVTTSWEPLLAITGTRALHDAHHEAIQVGPAGVFPLGRRTPEVAVAGHDRGPVRRKQAAQAPELRRSVG